MRLLHTSDWHLGRSLHGADLRAAQAGFVTALVESARDAAVDVVVVAGDVYDRAVPPVAAVELFESALHRLREVGATVVVSSGNHDSAIRLGANASLIAAGGVHLRTRPAALATPLLVHDVHGPVGVYAVPYLEPAAVAHALPGLTGPPPRGQAGVLGHAATVIAADATSRGLARTVVVAHAWVTGGQSSASERDISIGGVGQVSASTFAPFSYTALGHLHGQQVVADRVRYSGSPLPYSFSEARHRKGWWLVELDAHGVAGIEAVAAPVFRGLAQVQGELEQLLTSREFTGAETAFLAVTLTDAARPADAMARLRARFPHVLTLAWEPVGGLSTVSSYAGRVRHKPDLEVAQGFVEHVRGVPPAPAERELLHAAFDAVRLDGAVA